MNQRPLKQCRLIGAPWILLGLAGASAQAQSTSTHEPPMLVPAVAEAPTLDIDGSARWRLQFEPMLWAPALNGNLDLTGGSEFDIDLADMSEVNAAAAWQVSLREERWTLTLDGFDFEDSGDARANGPFEGGGTSVVRGDVVDRDIDYAGYTLTAGYRVWNMPVDNVVDGINVGPALSPFETPSDGVGVFVDLLAGARLYDLDLDLESEGAVLASESETWVDAIVGARLTIDLPAGFLLDVASDFGALGSEFAWNIEVGLQYAVSDTFAAEIGFRHMNTHFEADGGSDPFEWDVTLAGLYGSIVIRF